MAKLTIEIPDEIANDVINILAKRFGYQDMVMEGATEIANPQPKSSFVKGSIINYLKTQYREAKADEAVLAHINDLDGLI